MDGIHDLGGKHGFGEVEREADEPPFHARWEGAVFTMSTVPGRAGANNNTDRFRHAVERIDPVAYLTHTYYGRWLGAIETLLVEAGILTTKEITAKAVSLGGAETDRVAARPSTTPDPLASVAEAETADRKVDAPARFKVGDAVVTTSEVKSGHTRLPAYARGKPGIIHSHHGGWVYPDANAHGQGENPQHLYTVRFRGTDLWGDNSDSDVAVFLDLFEPYLKEARNG